MNNYNLMDMYNLSENIHPKQMIVACDEVIRSLYKVKIQYVTKRKNTRDRFKYVITDKLNPNYKPEIEIQNWVKDYNESYEHRQISNVKILDSQCLGYIRI